MARIETLSITMAPIILMAFIFLTAINSTTSSRIIDELLGEPDTVPEEQPDTSASTVSQQ